MDKNPIKKYDESAKKFKEIVEQTLREFGIKNYIRKETYETTINDLFYEQFGDKPLSYKLFENLNLSPYISIKESKEEKSENITNIKIELSIDVPKMIVYQTKNIYVSHSPDYVNPSKPFVLILYSREGKKIADALKERLGKAYNICTDYLEED